MVEIDRIALALSDPTRLRILDLLMAGRSDACCSPVELEGAVTLCPCDLLPSLGNVTPSRLSYHMKELRESGLVEERRRGKWNYYSVNHETFQAFVAAIKARYGAGREVTLSLAVDQEDTRARTSTIPIQEIKR